MKSPFKLRLLFLIGILFFLDQGIAFSQPKNPKGPKPAVPITGIEILIGAGAIIGAKKLAGLRKKK